MASRRFALGLLVFLVVSALALIAVGLWSRGAPAHLAAHNVLVFRVPYSLKEGAPPRRAFPFGGIRPEPLTLWQVVRGLRAAARDPRVSTVVVHVADTDWGWGRIAEVRDALLEVRAQGKPVFASVQGGGEAEYLLASAAETVAAPPVASLQLDGLAMYSLFLRGTFDKLDIVPNFVHVGRYKSAAESYTRGSMSEPAREMLDRLIDDEYALLVDSLAAAREMTPDSVRSLLDRGPFTSAGALEAGWVDTLLYDDEVDSLALDSIEGDGQTITLTRYLSRLRGNPTAARIALVVASGTIAPGKSRGSAFEGDLVGSETLIDALREATKRSSVKAIVLRVDSPGGDAFASDAVWREVERCRRTKPVVVSMSDLAASGGYYISMAADAIVAQPGTLTGSIGIFGGKLNTLGLYRKLGLNVEGVTRGRRAEMMSPYRDFTAEERGVFQRQMEDFYRQFVAKVAQGRGLDEAVVDSVGGGRVWTGWAAQDLGLVDELGGLPAALFLAKEKAGLDPEREVQVTVYPRVERSLLERFLAEMVREDDDEDAYAWVPPALKGFLAAARLPAGAPWALMPYSFEFR